MYREQEAVIINHIKATVKDVKVTGKGIQVNFENVNLTGEQISQISALVSGPVYLDIEERFPQLEKKEANTPVGQTGLFEYEDDEDEEELPVKAYVDEPAQDSKALTEAEVTAELGLE